jgi:solute carrier family 35 (UDP-sugar transporter), member A1/2/3
VAQNTALVLTMRYSLVGSATPATDERYNPSTAIFCNEVLKLIICVAVVIFTHKPDIVKDVESADVKSSNINALNVLMKNTVYSPKEMIKLAVPSLLYTIQNNLLFFALKNLEAATYQVFAQIKILTTAFFAVTMLGKKLTRKQWIALVCLTLGVALTQMNPNSNSDSQSSSFWGLIAVVLACTTSGFTGVYFERILKSSNTNLWIRNIQLGITATVLALMNVYASDGAKVREHGFLYGYGPAVWSVVCLQAAGGLLVAAVMKYADNILKGFATAMSIICSCLLSVLLFGFQPSGMFLSGASLVLGAIYLYS